MPKIDFYAGRANVWPHITALAGRVKRRRAALAYVGKDAPQLLPLGDGDELFVDASPEVLAQGLTSPDALEVYVNDGVHVRSLPGLHAKTLLLGRTAVIGSANASHSSAYERVEAVTMTTDPAVVTRVRDFLSMLPDYPGLMEVTDEFLTTARQSYRTPKPGPKLGHKLLPDGDFPLALTWLPYAELSDAAADVIGRHRRAACKITGPAAQFRIGYIELDHADRGAYRVGDVLVALYEEDDGHAWVAPPATVVLVKDLGPRKGQIVFVREDQTLDPMGYEDLRHLVPTLPASPPDDEWLIRKVQLREQLLDAWGLS